MRSIWMKAALCLFIVLGACSSQGDYLDDEYYTDMYSYDQTGILGRGMNMGNFLESPYSEGGEGAWNVGVIQQEYFTTIAAAGFKHVRIPVRWSDYAATSDPYTINATFMNRVKEVVGWATDAGLIAVINTHHYNEMFASANATILDGHAVRLNAIWSQICDAFTTANYPVTELYFEPLNEPNGAVGYTEWNDIIADITTIIWTTKAQTGRKIVIGTANWGGVGGLSQLDLPSSCNSGNTIITFHYYEPFHFTHQGAEWVTGANNWIGTSWTGTASERAAITNHYDGVVDWNESNGNFELWMGEFGAYTKYIDPEMQRAWTAFCTREAEKRGISWAYWEFCAGFGAYDPVAEAWKAHLLNGPLIPVD